MAMASENENVLHFSDGTLDMNFKCDTPSVEKNDTDIVNLKELTWMPWMKHVTYNAGCKALEVCDYLGESLASFFGITTPKYQFEINEYHRIVKENEEHMQELKDVESAGWLPRNSSTIQTSSDIPSQMSTTEQQKY